MAFGSGGHGSNSWGSTSISIPIVPPLSGTQALEFVVDNEPLVFELNGTTLTFIVDDETLVLEVK